MSNILFPKPNQLNFSWTRDEKKRQALRTRMDVQKLYPYNEIINAVSVICIRADRVYILLVFAWFYLASRWALERLLSSRQSSLTWVASDCTPTISSAEKRDRVLLNVVLWDALAKAKDFWSFIILFPRISMGNIYYNCFPRDQSLSDLL